MTTVVFSLGSNVGNRHDYLNRAIERLRETGIIIKDVSSFYETSPWGYKEQSPFINAVVKAETLLLPQELLDCIKKIEYELGRKETFKWGPREIDIDILFYGNEVIKDEQISIPHPYIQEREFVLIPLSEIMPEWIHPVFSKDIKTLLHELKGGNGHGKDN